MAGELATIGTFSFFPSKNLGGYGDGGMMVTQDEAIAARLKRLRMHGGAKMYFHDEVGFNSRLDALQAAMLQAKLPHLEAWSAKRRSNAAYYDAHLPTCRGSHAVRRPRQRVDLQPVYHSRRKSRRSSEFSQGARNRHGDLLSAAVASATCFAYLGYKQGSCPESERAATEVLSLPIYPELTTAQLDEVIEGVRAYYGH